MTLVHQRRLISRLLAYIVFKSVLTYYELLTE